MIRAGAAAFAAALSAAAIGTAAEPSRAGMADAAQRYAETRVAGNMDALIAAFPPRVAAYLRDDTAQAYLLDPDHLAKWGPKDFFMEFDLEGAEIRAAGDLRYAVVPSLSRTCAKAGQVQENAQPALLLFEDGAWFVTRLGPSELTTLVAARYPELAHLPFRELKLRKRRATAEEAPKCP